MEYPFQAIPQSVDEVDGTTITDLPQSVEEVDEMMIADLPMKNYRRYQYLQFSRCFI
jgi:hypothetical protein